MARLTTTSYALLGLLRRGSFSAYELTGHMRRSALAHLWPRTEAGIYKEPAKLVEHGLAKAAERSRGGRRRTVYTITPKGRRALAQWLEVPAEAWRLESEAAVKVFLGDGGSLEALRSHLTSLAGYKPQEEPPGPELVDDWIEGRMRFPEQVHYTAMAADLITRVNVAIGDWALDWLDRTESWETTELDETSRTQAMEVLSALRTLVGTPPRDRGRLAGKARAR